MTESKNIEKYRIKGKTYYKIQEEYVPEADRDIVSEIWNIKNSKGEEFRLLIRNQKSGKQYSLYMKNGNCLFRTHSISKIERN